MTTILQNNEYEVVEDQAVVYHLDVYVPINTEAVYELEVLAPFNDTARMKLCDVFILSNGMFTAVLQRMGIDNVQMD